MSSAAPFIVYANHANFSGVREVYQPEVESRLCLWSRSGGGEVVVNRSRIPLKPFDLLFLPWGIEMRYLPDRASPFHLSGIHLIPSLQRGDGLEYQVSHGPDSPLHHSALRQDACLPGLSGICRLRAEPHSPLFLLAEYIVGHFQGKGRSAEQLERLALALLSELRLTQNSEHSELGEIPQALRELMQYSRDNLDLTLSTRDLARQLGLSTSQTRRLFHRWLKVSPVEWLNGLRVERARELLTTTRLPVAKVAPRLGFSDPFYFSRFFRRETGLSPLACRRSGSMV